jgi:protein-tyrosine kinase
MRLYKHDSLKTSTGINLVTRHKVDPDVEVESGKEDTAGRQKISSTDPPNPDTVKILGRLRERGMLVPGSKLSGENKNEYRRIKRPLLSNAFGKTAPLVDHGNLIMVTSSVTGEGKTYMAVNLALAVAQERDHTVLLVDCDVTKQGASRLLGVEKRRPDFTDLLASETSSVADALLRTDVPGLVLLPAGRPHEFITEMIASQRMARLVKELGSRYSDRLLIFDAPPLLATPETQVLAGLVGQVVFVIEAGKTPHSIVEEALQMIPKEKAIGLVLNKSESLSSRGGYYYNYYTPYGEKGE